MTYRAIIEHRQTGERRTIKLGRCSDMSTACDRAKAMAPAGWIVYDVRGA